jgi:hypothetical protein
MTNSNPPGGAPADPIPPQRLTEEPYNRAEEPYHRADHPSSGRRRVIPATCELHRAAVDFTNLLVTKLDGTIVLDPHVDGSCVIRLGEDGATTLRNTLTEWLG